MIPNIDLECIEMKAEFKVKKKWHINPPEIYVLSNKQNKLNYLTVLAAYKESLGNIFYVVFLLF